MRRKSSPSAGDPSGTRGTYGSIKAIGSLKRSTDLRSIVSNSCIFMNIESSQRSRTLVGCIAATKAGDARAWGVTELPLSGGR